MLEQLPFSRRRVVWLLQDMPERNIREVNGDNRIRVAASKLFRDRAAPVPAMRPELFIAEPRGHQLRPKVIDPEDRSDLRRLVRKSITRQVWHDDIESIFRPSAERRGISEHRNDFRETIKRIRIAVCEEQRERIRPLAAFMDEVDADVIYFGFEVSESIESRLLLAPV